jgi:hypothetical protein
MLRLAPYCAPGGVRVVSISPSYPRNTVVYTHQERFDEAASRFDPWSRRSRYPTKRPRSPATCSRWTTPAAPLRRCSSTWAATVTPPASTWMLPGKTKRYSPPLPLPRGQTFGQARIGPCDAPLVGKPDGPRFTGDHPSMQVLQWLRGLGGPTRHSAASGIYPGITHMGDARAYAPQHTSAIVRS